jgi:hypothetical protein
MTQYTMAAKENFVLEISNAEENLRNANFIGNAIIIKNSAIKIFLLSLLNEIR